MSATASPNRRVLRPWHDRRCYVCGRRESVFGSVTWKGSRPSRPVKLVVLFRPGDSAKVMCDGDLERAQRESDEWAYCPLPRTVRS